MDLTVALGLLFFRRHGQGLVIGDHELRERQRDVLLPFLGHGGNERQRALYFLDQRHGRLPLQLVDGAGQV
jgi:hypothetical protein